MGIGGGSARDRRHARRRSPSGSRVVPQSDSPAAFEERCFDCHADGGKKGGVAFDGFASDAELLADKELWFRVLKNVRGGLMPPPEKDQPTPEQRQQLARWIKSGPSRSTRRTPTPAGSVLRRLNRVEYRNTIRDLIGVDYGPTRNSPPTTPGTGSTTSATC